MESSRAVLFDKITAEKFQESLFSFNAIVLPEIIYVRDCPLRHISITSRMSASFTLMVTGAAVSTGLFRRKNIIACSFTSSKIFFREVVFSLSVIFVQRLWRKETCRQPTAGQIVLKAF